MYHSDKRILAVVVVYWYRASIADFRSRCLKAWVMIDTAFSLSHVRSLVLIISSSTTVCLHNTLLPQTSQESKTSMILQIDDKRGHDSDLPNKPPSSRLNLPPVSQYDPPPAYSGPGPAISISQSSYTLPTSSEGVVSRQPSRPSATWSDNSDGDILTGREYEQRCKHYLLPRRGVDEG